MHSSTSIPPLFLGLIGLATAGAAAASAQTTIYHLPGDSAGDRYGAAVAAISDVDGDLLPDLLVAAPGGLGATGYARVISGAKGTIARSFFGTVAGGEFGAALSAADFNSDGRADPLIGAYLAGAGGRGTVTAYDGLSGQPIWALAGNAAGDHFGFALAGLSDVSGDGLPDAAIGAVDDDDQGSSSGTVRVVSGFDGSTLYTLTGTGVDELFGYALAALGDLDGDGIGDLAIGAPHVVSAANTAPGSVRVVSAASGATLFSVPGKAKNDAFGRALASTGDLDLDGKVDLLIGAPQPMGGMKGYAQLVSGAGGGLLLEVAGLGSGDLFAAAVAPAGDVNGDGTSDLAIGAPRDDDAGSDSGSVFLFSGKDGAQLAQLMGSASNHKLGAALAGGFDPSGDAVVDVALGSEGDGGAGVNAGSARVVSTRNLVLSSDIFMLSASSPSSQVLRLDAGPAHAGSNFVVLGSLSGILPGTSYNSLPLGLNPDRYFKVTLKQLPGGPLSAPAGQLDALGQASVTFALPPSVPAGLLIGLTFDHACVLTDAVGNPVLSSNSVPVTMAP